MVAVLLYSNTMAKWRATMTLAPAEIEARRNALRMVNRESEWPESLAIVGDWFARNSDRRRRTVQMVV
jgi:hypothetical protein